MSYLKWLTSARSTQHVTASENIRQIEIVTKEKSYIRNTIKR